MAMEAGIMKDILNGSYERPWVKAKLKALGYEIEE